MKIFNKAFAALMFLPLMAGLTACHDEHAEYNPAEAGASSAYDVARLVYFAPETTAATDIELSEDENSFYIYLQRDSIGGELEVKLQTTQKAGDAKSLLSVPESVTFPDSVGAISVEVTYDPAAILAGGGMQDTVSIVIPDGTTYQSGYMGGRYDFVATLFPFTPWCTSAEEFAAAGGQGKWPFRQNNTGTWSYKAWQKGDFPGASVAMRQNTENPNQVQFLIQNWGAGMFTGSGVQARLSGSWDDSEKVYVLSLPETFTGYVSSSYGNVYISDWSLYSNSTWDEYPTMYDPETGLFTVNLVYYVGAGYYGYGAEYLQMDGFLPYEANIFEDFEWKNYLDGEFTSAKMSTKASTTLYQGVCKNTTDNCDATFAETYGTLYKLEAPYANGYDLYFCINSEGNIINAPGLNEDGSILQPTGVTALDQAIFAKINHKQSSMQGKKLTLSISFVNADESIEYGTSNEVFSATSWKSLGMGLYTDDVVGPMFSAEPITYEVEIQENEDVAGHYRLVNAYGAAYPYNEEGDWDDSKDYYLEIHAENPSEVYIPHQDLGLDWGYGMFSIWSFGDYNGTNFGTLENGIITFPERSLLMSMANYEDGALYYANNNGAFQVVLPSARGAKAFVAAKSGKVSHKVKATSKTAVKKHTATVNWKGRRVGSRLERTAPKRF